MIDLPCKKKKIKDYSINDYLNRLSIEELETLLTFCKEQEGEYAYVIKDIYKTLNEKPKLVTLISNHILRACKLKLFMLYFL